MSKELIKIKRDISVIRNSVECIKDSNCILIIKHLLLVLDDIIKFIDKQNNRTNTCKYCNKNETNSPDPDVLCLECREIFGHSFFSEL